MSDPVYDVGQKVRIRFDEPSYTDLSRGDIVTIVDFQTRISPHGEVFVLIYVENEAGKRLIALEEVEPLGEEPAAHRPGAPAIESAEPDDVVDSFFEKIMRADRELLTVVHDAAAQLPAVSRPLANEEAPATAFADQLTVAPVVAEEAPLHGSNLEPTEFEVVALVDADGEEMSAAYVEAECPDHGRESWFVFEIDGAQIGVLTPNMREFLGWMLNRLKHSERPE